MKTYLENVDRFFFDMLVQAKIDYAESFLQRNLIFYRSGRLTSAFESLTPIMDESEQKGQLQAGRLEHLTAETDKSAD